MAGFWRSLVLVAGLMAAHVAGGGLLMASTHMDLGTVFSKNLRLGAVAA